MHWSELLSLVAAHAPRAKTGRPAFELETTLVDKGLMLSKGRVADATLIAAPSSTKNQDGQRAPEMHQTKKADLTTLCALRNLWMARRRLWQGLQGCMRPKSATCSSLVVAR